MDDRRYFNPKEKEALRLLSGGKCENCGKELGEDWHGDHVIPFLHGGKTQIENAQALCRQCNLKKGSTVRKNYRWQDICVEKIMRLEKRTILINACPGSGKTRMAAKLIQKRFEWKQSEKVIIVCPNDEIKTQWCDAMKACGVEINPDLDNSTYRNYGVSSSSDEFDGWVFTYAQLANNPKISRAVCSRWKTDLIGDEIHHCGSDRAWADAITDGFEKRVKAFLLTGTAWRHSPGKIPYVDYDERDIVLTDFDYSYSEAIADGIVRSIRFPIQAGVVRFKWKEKLYDLELNEENMSDELRRKTLWSALNPYDQNGFLAFMLQNAYDELTELRKVNASAAMLVVGRDIDHVEAIAMNAFRKIAPDVEPVIVHSRDSDSGNKIEAFKKSADPVIFTVKKISEGIDIPRLQVGVYAGRDNTELSFRQTLGRTIRIPEDQLNMVDYPFDTAFWYIPNIIPLPEMARRIEDEVEIAAKLKEDKDPDEPNKPRDHSEEEDDFEYISSKGTQDTIIHRGKIYRLEYTSDERPKYKIKRDLSEEVTKRVRSIAGRFCKQIYKQWREEVFQEIFRLLPGGPYGKCSSEDMQRKLEILDQRSYSEWKEMLLKRFGKMGL